MAYFDQIDKINFEGQEIDNFYFSYRIPDRFNLGDNYIPYRVRDYERPERVAEDMYGSTDSWWLILEYNNMVDMFQDWPKDNFELEIEAELVSKRLYGENYTLAQFTEVYDELFQENESKREIKIPRSGVKEMIVKDVNNFFRSQRES